MICEGGGQKSCQRYKRRKQPWLGLGTVLPLGTGANYCGNMTFSHNLSEIKRAACQVRCDESVLSQNDKDAPNHFPEINEKVKNMGLWLWIHCFGSDWTTVSTWSIAVKWTWGVPALLGHVGCIALRPHHVQGLVLICLDWTGKDLRRWKKDDIAACPIEILRKRPRSAVTTEIRAELHPCFWGWEQHLARDVCFYPIPFSFYLQDIDKVCLTRR